MINFSAALDWLSALPMAALAALLFVALAVAAWGGATLRNWESRHTRPGSGERFEGYMASAVVGLLALLIGFTFSIAMDRFETRRLLVLQEANAIRATYLLTQVLEQPHRSRIGGLLLQYTDNRIALADAPTADIKAPLAVNDRLIIKLWAATAAAFDADPDADFAASLLTSVNNLVALDAGRQDARTVHVPAIVFGTLFTYLLATAVVLGYLLTGYRGRAAAAMLLILQSMALLLIVDIDRPTMGTVREDQEPMIHMRAALMMQPAEAFDLWRSPQTPSAGRVRRGRAERDGPAQPRPMSPPSGEEGGPQPTTASPAPAGPTSPPRY